MTFQEFANIATRHFHARLKVRICQFLPVHFSFWALGPGAQVNWEWIKREDVFKCKTPNSNLMPLKYIVAGLIRVNPKFESAAGTTVNCEWLDTPAPCHQVKKEKKYIKNVKIQKVQCRFMLPMPDSVFQKLQLTECYLERTQIMFLPRRKEVNLWVGELLLKYLVQLRIQFAFLLFFENSTCLPMKNNMFQLSPLLTQTSS